MPIGATPSAGARFSPIAWRRALRDHLAWLLVAKLAVLVLLWALFFSPGHRTSVDSEAAARQLAVVRLQPVSAVGREFP